MKFGKTCYNQKYFYDLLETEKYELAYEREKSIQMTMVCKSKKVRQCEKVYESKKTYEWQKKYANVKKI